MASSTFDYLPATLGAAATVLVLRWLLASRTSTASQQDGAWLLSYSRAWRVLIGLFALVPVAILVLAAIFPASEDQRWIPWAMAGGFAAVVLPLAVEVLGVVHHFDQIGITSKTPWRARRAALSWSDVSSVRYNASAQWYVLRGRNGDVVRVSRYLSGLGTFATSVLASVPSSALNEGTRQQLSSAAKD